MHGQENIKIIYLRLFSYSFICCKWNSIPVDSHHTSFHLILKISVPTPQTETSRCLILKTILKNAFIYRRDKNKHIALTRLRCSSIFRTTRNFRSIAQNGSTFNHLHFFSIPQNKGAKTILAKAATIIVNRLSGRSFILLKPTGHVMHQQFNIQQLYALPTLHLCVLYLSENKQRLVPLTA